jgi:hypothetical protein
MIRKVADEVYITDHVHAQYESQLLHECDEGEWMHKLTLRENAEGPLYWCPGCGKTIENGEAMAIRLFEADF